MKQGIDGEVIPQFPEPRLDPQNELALTDEIERKLEPDEEEKATDIAQEMAEVIALIAHG